MLMILDAQPETESRGLTWERGRAQHGLQIASMFWP